MSENVTHTSFPCTQCGAFLVFKPGSNHLKCEYCGTENEIQNTVEEIEELSFEHHAETEYEAAEKYEVKTVECKSCKAETTFNPLITSDSCSFCGTSIVLTDVQISYKLKPKSLLPFKINSEEGKKLFKTWLTSLWFAPSNLRKIGNAQKLDGMYMPFWTYDSEVVTSYIGQRGEHYYVRKEITNSEGQRETVEERHTRWYPAVGEIQVNFDDILVPASESLPYNYLSKLEPWDLQELVPYNESYLSGFKTESYRVNLKQGFEDAKSIIEPEIEHQIRRDIGGDDQTIITSKSRYYNTTFKHILLPMWISAYKYNTKTYRFIVNARTGEVQGERPYSVGKIIGTILSGTATGCSFYFGGVEAGLVATPIFALLLFKVFK